MEKKISSILASYVEYKIFFFGNHWPLLSNILAGPQVPEDRHYLKRNTVTSLEINSVILNEIWRCCVFGKPKQAKKRLIWFLTGYPSPPSTKINGLMEYSNSGKGNVW